MVTWRIIIGDVRQALAEVPAGSVQCCVTSPPYWGLRDYGHEGQIGNEATPEEYVAALVGVFRDVSRTLRDDGLLFVNLGDVFNAYNGGAGPSGQISRRQHEGRPKLPTGYGLRCKTLKPKDLLGMPWRLALALQADGWFLRMDIIWSKPNPMPESVSDRPTKAHEYIFMLAKSERYFYDADAIAERAVSAGKVAHGPNSGSKARADASGTNDRRTATGLSNYTSPIGEKRNARSVWTINTEGYDEAHFATFPEELPERCIKAASRVGDCVLDPFAGSGTTGFVAVQLGRSFIGCELNPEYAELTRRRIRGAATLYAQEIA